MSKKKTKWKKIEPSEIRIETIEIPRNQEILLMAFWAITWTVSLIIILFEIYKPISLLILVVLMMIMWIIGVSTTKKKEEVIYVKT